MKYPKAGDLQRATSVQITSNPALRNPYEVRSASGLEGVFADPDDAEFYAQEIRESGARDVTVGRRDKATRPRPPKHAIHTNGCGCEDNPGPRVLREKWGDSTDIVIERHRYGISGWLENKRGGGRIPISFGDKKPETLREAMEEAKKFLNRVYGKSNPAGIADVVSLRPGDVVELPDGGTAAVERVDGDDVYVIEWNKKIARGPWIFPAGELRLVARNPAGLTAKGERMYEHIKEGYGDDPRAKEIAARTVLSRAKQIPGLTSNPPNVLPVPGQRIRSWDHGEGKLVRICEEGTDGSYTARIQLDNGSRVTVPLTRTEYDLAPRKGLERRTGFSRHEQFIGAPAPERFPRGTPVEFEDTALAPARVHRGPMEYDEDRQEWVPVRHRIVPRRR